MFLYGIGVILLFITALRFLGMARKKENPHEKLINRAFGIVFICLTIQFSLLVLYFLSLEGYTVDHSYRGNLELEHISLLSEWLHRGSWIPFYTFTAIFIRAGDKIRNKKIPVGIILGIIGIFFTIFVPFEMFFILNLIPLIIMAIYYFHVLFTLMKWAKKELKAATSFVILGSLFIGNSIVFATPFTMMSGAMPSILIPLSLITGAILCVAPTFLNPKFFLQSTSYWYAFCASAIGFYAFNSVFFIFFTPEYAINGFIMLIYISLECAFILKALLKEEGTSTKKNVGVIGVFTRPETVTEEEVSVSKEKKICLVCKGKIAGDNYICPDCNAFYCFKCKSALINMENACWACDTALDPSKPVKLDKKKEQEVDIEISEPPQKSPKTDTKPHEK